MKHKKLIITLSIISGVLLLIGGTCLGFCLNGTSQEYSETIPDSQNEWMKSIKDDTKLKNIVIPGSHDAMTVGMSYLAATQNADMEESLDMGIRYFDLRVNYVDNTLKIYHSFFNGIELKPCLEKAAEFLVDHPSESLILDFQHFKNNAQGLTYSAIHEIFPSSLIVDKTDENISDLNYVASLSLKDVRGKALLLWGDYSRGDLADIKSDLFPRDNDECTYETTSCLSYYNADLHKKDSETFIKESLPEQFSIAQKAKDENRLALFVLQSQLTDGMGVFGPYSREKSHDENMSNAINDLYDSVNLALTNIIMRDFVNTRKCKEIIRLNIAKDLIKEENKTSFSAQYTLS